MSSPRVRLGDLLVEAQIITREQLTDVLALQRKDGRRLGTLLLEAGLVTETQVTQILSQQLSVPWVSLYHIDFSRQLLNLVPRAIAEKYCLVPIFVRRVRGLGETLYVAMDDPTDETAHRDVSQFVGLPVRAMIAPPSDIRSAIRVYYGAGTRSSSLSEAEAEAAGSSELEATTEREPVRARAAALPTESAAPARGVAGREPTAEQAAVPGPAPAAPTQPGTSSPESDPHIEARELGASGKRGAPVKMISLTLLDGTEIRLPARSSAAQQAAHPEGDQLTARDLVAALRAVSHGADAGEILGDDVRWESMLAALLSLLLKKHLIADWEFVEEYRKS